MSAVSSQPRTVLSTPLTQTLSRWWLLIALVLVGVVFVALTPNMIDAANIATVLRSASITAIMVLGLTWVAASGKIDVSFMQIAALANMVTAALVAAGYGWIVGSTCGLVVGALVGALNGLLVGVFRLPPLIVTIATGGACGSAAAALGQGSPIRIEDAGPLGGFLMASVGFFPVIAIIVALLYAAAWYGQEHLTFGRYVYATASNEEAVIEAGVLTRRLITLLYALSALFASVAGVLLVASLSSGQPMIGASYFLDGLTAVMLGGMMIRLGQPNVLGSATSVLLLATLVSGGALLGWPDYLRDIVKGILLVGGVGLSVWMRGRSKSSMRRRG